MDEELMPKLRCTITGMLGLFSYSCTAPLTIRSLAEIADSVDELPFSIKDRATKALAKRIYFDLSFNSTNHSYVI
jgi:hypothetical protein